MVKPDKLFFVIALLFPIIIMSCKHNTDTGEELSASSDTQYIVVAFYRPDGMGDRSWSDTFCLGLHTISESRKDMLSVDICPQNMDETMNYIEGYMDWGTEVCKNYKLLFLFADECYLPIVENLMKEDNILSKKQVSALVFCPQKSLSVCTVSVPLYGASYLAGLAAKKIVDEPKVFSIVERQDRQDVRDCLNGFTEGLGKQWDGTIQEIDLYSESMEIKESDFFVTTFVTDSEDQLETDPELAYVIASLINGYAFSNICIPLCYGDTYGILHYNRDFSKFSFYTVGMDVDMSNFSDKVPFSIVRHVDKVVGECINQWINGKEFELRQVFGLEKGYTELIISKKFQTEALNSLISEAKNIAITKEVTYENNR